MKNEKCDISKNKIINLKDIDEHIKKTKQNADRIEREVIELHKKITLLL